MLISVLKLNVLAYALNVALIPWGSFMSRFPGYVTIITTILLPFLAMNRSLTFEFYGEKKAFFFFCGILVASLLLSLSEVAIDQNYILAILGLACMYGTLSISPTVYTEKDLEQFFLISKILSVILIIYAVGPFQFKYSEYDEWGNTWFTLGFDNPNDIAVRIMFCVAMLLIETAYRRKLKYKLINTALAIGLIYVIILTESRTSLICSCVMVAMIWLNRTPLKLWYVDIAIIIMISFIAVQLWLGTRENVVFLGKTVASGRQKLYASYMKEIVEKPWKFIVGDVGKYELANSHNAAFAIVQNLGFLGLVCFVAFWKSLIRNSISSITNEVNKAAIFVLLIYIIYSSAEAAPMIGMIPHSTPMLVIGRLSKDHLRRNSVYQKKILRGYCR